MDDSVLYKYVSSTIKEEEKAVLLEWLKANPDNQRLLFETEMLWKLRKSGRSGEIDQEEKITNILSTLHRRMDEYEKSKRTTLIPLYTRWAGMAAAILLCVAISYLYLSKSFTSGLITEMNTADDFQVKQLSLPDGSTVWLAAQASLTYPVAFNTELREVELEGEAFFEVKRNEEVPFVVKTKNQDVRVLGTSFSVKTKEDEKQTETLLMSGSVQLEKKGKALTVLYPGQRALYSEETDELEISEADVNSLTSWRFGLVFLSEATLYEIITCLEKTYDIRTFVAYEQPIHKTKRYNFSFKRDKGPAAALEQLALITETNPIILE